MKIREKEVIDLPKEYRAPKLKYYKSRKELDIGVGKDFIKFANRKTKGRKQIFVGLSHGTSPSGAYEYILEHYDDIKRPKQITYTFINTPLRRQRDLKKVMDAGAFLAALLRRGYLTRDNILGAEVRRTELEKFLPRFQSKVYDYLELHNKQGMDYVFLAMDSAGRVAGISRNSEAFESEEIATIINDRKQQEITITPSALCKSGRIAFIVTKSEKRRALARLLRRTGLPDESPSFLRHMEEVEKRMTVHVDSDSLTWPQVVVKRRSIFGMSEIKIDVARPYSEDSKKKLPVILLIHGFMGLNSYDAILAEMPVRRYIAAAMHYGSIPDQLPINRYSTHVVNNIDAVVGYFGSKGHPVYIFDHSMGNIYFLMINRDLRKLKNIKKYLCGRIGANPFFGEEAKHAYKGFLKSVIVPGAAKSNNLIEKTMFRSALMFVRLNSKERTRKNAIRLTELAVKKDSKLRRKVWEALRTQIIRMMTGLDSLPHLNRIPIQKALNRLPSKLFFIQLHSALLESETFDEQVGLGNIVKLGIPVWILKSERDAIAKFVFRHYDDGITKIIDVTNTEETDLFREHLFHMVNPAEAVTIIQDFVAEVEEDCANDERHSH